MYYQTIFVILKKKSHVKRLSDSVNYKLLNQINYPLSHLNSFLKHVISFRFISLVPCRSLTHYEFVGTYHICNKKKIFICAVATDQEAANCFRLNMEQHRTILIRFYFCFYHFRDKMFL